MRRPAFPFFTLAPALLVAAILAAGGGCKDEHPAPAPTEAPSAPASAASAAPTESATPTAPAPLLRREGGALALGLGEPALYVADEDHGVVRRVPLPLAAHRDAAADAGAADGGVAAAEGVEAVPVPGAPAQVLPLEGRVLVTVRDPGLLLVLKRDAGKGLVESARVS